MNKPLPSGCDDQGRWPTRQPMSAEAATDEGAEPDFKAAAMACALFWLGYGSILFVALVAAAAAFL